MDAQAALEFLLSRRDIDKRKIIIFGRSLGGAVAIYLAASPAYSDKYVLILIIIIIIIIIIVPCRILALMVENTFTGIPHMAQLMIPGASSFPTIFFKNKVIIITTTTTTTIITMMIIIIV